MFEKLETPETLQKAIEFFADEDRAHAYLAQQRWPDGNVVCPSCNQANPRWLAKQRRFECRKKHPKRQFSVKVGTIFEDSPIPLKSWLLAVWQITNCKNGISSYELASAVGVTQKSAWFMNHRIRLAMQGDDGGTLDGEVEVDETYIGGKARNMNRTERAERLARNEGRKNSWFGKVAVLGLLQRHSERGKSQVRTLPVDNIKTYRLRAEVTKRVEDGATVYTDALKSYTPLSIYYTHKVIDHAEKYVDGVVHTNGLENYWALLKRTIRGTYVSVEPFHLFRYLDEQAFRFNQRSDSPSGRFTATLRRVTGRRITYEELIGHPVGA
jgi:transposase-like protein